MLENGVPPSPEGSPLPEKKLVSWKEIAAHLGREVRTVQRWEKTEGLPVKRHEHLKKSTVYAYPSELDDWVRKRQPVDDPEADEFVARIAMRRERLQFDDEDAAQVIAGLLVEMARDVEHLMQLRHQGQALLKLVEGQSVDAGKVVKKVIVEDGQPPVLGELHIHFDDSRA
jgi:hypothetical protein